MPVVDTILQFFILVALEVLYLRLAIRFDITDKPNHRSSHSFPTVRGGGIIFIAAIILWFLMNQAAYGPFVLGSVLIAGISFADDLGERPAALRFSIHAIAILLLSWQVELFSLNVWLVVVVLVLALGAINAFNFMDGINGMTGIYVMICLLTFLFVDQLIFPFTQPTLAVVMILAVVVFLFFNFRKKARCFAGDVGSVTLAFLLIFLMLQLVLKTGSYVWILMFLVYGIDSVVTIIYRLRRKENIFKPHRSHLYQYLSNEMKISHRLVSAGYGVVQLLINSMLILFFIQAPVWYFWVFILLSGLLYVVIREWVLKQVAVKGLFVRN